MRCHDSHFEPTHIYPRYTLLREGCSWNKQMEKNRHTTIYMRSKGIDLILAEGEISLASAVWRNGRYCFIMLNKKRLISFQTIRLPNQSLLNAISMRPYQTMTNSTSTGQIVFSFFFIVPPLHLDKFPIVKTSNNSNNLHKLWPL